MWPSDILEEKILLFSSSLGCADVGDWKRSFPIDNHTQHIAYTNIICTTPSPTPRRLGKFKTPHKHHLLVYMVWCVMGRYIYIYIDILIWDIQCAFESALTCLMDGFALLFSRVSYFRRKQIEYWVLVRLHHGFGFICIKLYGDSDMRFLGNVN